MHSGEQNLILRCYTVQLRTSWALPDIVIICQMFGFRIIITTFFVQRPNVQQPVAMNEARPTVELEVRRRTVLQRIGVMFAAKQPRLHMACHSTCGGCTTSSRAQAHSSIQASTPVNYAGRACPRRAVLIAICSFTLASDRSNVSDVN